MCCLGDVPSLHVFIPRFTSAVEACVAVVLGTFPVDMAKLHAPSAAQHIMPIYTLYVWCCVCKCILCICTMHNLASMQ